VALSINNPDNAAELIRNCAGSHQYIFDFFIEEVLSRQPAEVVQFLDTTSILDKMCAPLCDAVLADPSISAQAMLEAIERSNLFIVSLDNERCWYRYHHLFRDLLLKRLHKNGTRAAGELAHVAELHLNASAWYAANGFTSDAFRHAIAAGDFEKAAGLAEKAWPGMENNFQHSAFIGQMKMLPPEVLSRHPVLCAGYAWSLLFTGKLEDAGYWIELTENRLRELRKSGLSCEHDAQHSVRLEEMEYSISLARIYKSLSEGNVPEASSILEKVMQGSTSATGGRYSAFVTYASMIDAWKMGNLPRALQFINCLMENLKKSGNRKMLSNMVIFKGYMLEISGSLNQAINVYLTALDTAQEQSNFSPANSLISLKAGVVLFEQGNLERAGHFLQESERTERTPELANRQYYWCIAQSQLKEFGNDIAGALDSLHEAQRYQIRSPIPEIAPLLAQIARLQIKQGNMLEVKDWIDQQNLRADDELSFIREYEHITLARYLIAHFRHKGDHSSLEAADTLLERLLGAATEGGRGSRVLELLILQALCLDARKDFPGALEKMEQAIAIAQPQKFVRIFIIEGAPMARLLSAAKARGMGSDHITTLLTFFKELLPDNQTQSSPLSAVKYNLLSERELEVLKLVEKGFSNLRIGEKLFISLSTVKGHNLKIFDKLNAKSRTEALVRAKELNLL